jgi:serine O-acetyltransferase
MTCTTRYRRAGTTPTGAVDMTRVIADLRQMAASWDAGPGEVVLRSLPRLLLYPRFRAVVAFRMSSWCWRHRLRPVALWLQARTIRSAGAEIHPAADLGPGFALVHSVGIVVGHEVVAGRNLALYQGVTLGPSRPQGGQPKIGNDVRIDAGAKVLGPVAIGDRARIAANSMVLGDVPAGVAAQGVWRGSPLEGIRVGVDLTSVTEVRSSITTFGQQYTKRVYTERELADSSSELDAMARSLAARFAAKEAVLKVLGNLEDPPRWTEIEVRRTPEGPCEIHLTGRAASLAAQSHLDTWAVSLTHEAEMAAAVVVASTEISR